MQSVFRNNVGSPAYPDSRGWSQVQYGTSFLELLLCCDIQIPMGFFKIYILDLAAAVSICRQLMTSLYSVVCYRRQNPNKQTKSKQKNKKKKKKEIFSAVLHEIWDFHLHILLLSRKDGKRKKGVMMELINVQ